MHLSARPRAHLLQVPRLLGPRPAQLFRSRKGQAPSLRACLERHPFAALKVRVPVSKAQPADFRLDPTRGRSACDGAQGVCRMMTPEMTRLSSVPATNMCCESTMYGTKFMVAEGLVSGFSASALRIPVLVVPSPPIDKPAPESTTFRKTPWFELNSEKSTVPETLLVAALDRAMWPTKSSSAWAMVSLLALT